MVGQKVEKFERLMSSPKIRIDEDYNRRVVRDARGGKMGIRAVEGPNPMLINKNPINFGGNILRGGPVCWPM